MAEPVERALEHHFRDLALGGEEIGEFGLGHRVENPQGQVHCEHLALDALEDRGVGRGVVRAVRLDNLHRARLGEYFPAASNR